MIAALLLLLATPDHVAREAVDALRAGTFADRSADTAAFTDAMRRYECASDAAMRVDSTTVIGDSASVELTGSSEFPPRWRVDLRRAGDDWRVVRVASRERDLATAMAFAEPARQDELARDCGELASPELVYQMVELGLVLGSKAQFKREERLATLAISIADDVRSPRSRARALWLLGRAQDSQESLDTALDSYEEARALAEANGDTQVLARALIGAGFTYSNRFEFSKAQEPLRRGLSIALSIGDHMIADNAYLAMAIMHLESGEWVAALRDFDRARDEAEKGGDRAVMAAATANSGLVFVHMNNYWLAADRLREAIAMYRALGNKRGEIRNLRNLADTEAAAHNFAESARILNRIEEYLAREPNDSTAAFIAATRTLVAIGHKDTAGADRYATQGLALAAKTSNRHLITYLTLTLSGIRLKQKRYQEAADLAEKGTELSLTNPSAYPLAKVRVAEAYEKLGRTDEAIHALTAAVNAIEGQLANVPGTEDEQQTFYSDKSGPYYQMFRMLVARQQPEQAIEWVERSRSRSLIEYLGRNRVSADRDLLSAEERADELARQQEIVALNRNLRELNSQPKKDAAAVAKLAEEVRQKRDSLQDYEAILYSRHPSLALARGALPRPSLAEVRKLIPKDGAVLQYVVDTDDTWVIVIGDSGPPFIRRIDIGAEALRRRVERFTSRIAQRDLGSGAKSRAMYELLLRPAEPVLRSKKSLCIIPDESLWQLPFQALVDGDGRYLVERKTIFYTPALSLLAWYANHRPTFTPTAGVLVLANPKLSEQTVAMAHSIQRGEDLGPLPDAEEEARQIKAMYRGDTKVVVGEAATEAFVKRNAGHYRIIHLATHAVFDDSSPLHSHLVLAAGTDSTEDGLLEAREIMNLDLAPDLVVLSSCETGRGQVRGGDGLIGMSWALLVAGCPTAIVSQWKVGSAGTAKLMTEFHRRLSRVPADGRREAAARSLRAADRAVMQMPEYRYPYDWSAFVVVGNGW